MKIGIFVLVGMFFTLVASACPVCEKQQPALLQGVSHGVGPQGNLDYVIVWVMTIIVALTLFFSVRMLVKPGERAENHIKRTILMTEDGNEK